MQDLDFEEQKQEFIPDDEAVSEFGYNLFMAALLFGIAAAVVTFFDKW